MSINTTISENGNKIQAAIFDAAELRAAVDRAVADTPVVDIHTHLFGPEFGEMNLYGIDELLTYHYLVAETFRSSSVSPEEFWRMPKPQRAETVWKALFVDNTPVSEAALGVVTVLGELGIDPNTRSLDDIRDWFREQDTSAHVGRVLARANVSRVVMTNDPLDPHESPFWTNGIAVHEKFAAALRMDRILNDWPSTAARLGCGAAPSDADIVAVRRFLDEWIERMQPLYMAVSLPDDFDYFADDARNRLIRDVVMPTALAHRLPFAVMIGVRRGVNPALKAAGDGVGRADVRSLELMCRENPEASILATYLSRENQHELCVAARKFANLTPFGCWWFLNNPSIIREITRERLELLGTSFIPQHSDARVLEQLIYKWKHSRRVIAGALAESYERLLDAGRGVRRAEIARDVERMFSGNFEKLTADAAIAAASAADAHGLEHH